MCYPFTLNPTAILAYIVVILSVSHLEGNNPNIVFSDKGGISRLIIGQQYVVGKARPFYYRSDEKVFITSINEVSINATSEDIDQYAILADQYEIIRKTSVVRGKNRNTFVLNGINFEKSLSKSWPKQDYQNDLFAIFWVQEGDLTPIYVGRSITHITALSLPSLGTVPPKTGYKGYPGLMIFRDGNARIPDDTFNTRLQLKSADFRHLEKNLLSAALNGFNEYLANNLPPRSKETEKLYDRLLSVSLQNGRATTATVIIESTLTADKPQHRRTSESNLLKALANGHLDAALSLLSYNKLKVMHDKESKLVEWAIQSGQFELADALLDFSYKYSSTKTRRPSGLRTCLAHNRLDYIDRLYPYQKPKVEDFKAPSSTSIFHEIAATATPQTLEYIKQFNIPIDLEDPDEFTPLIRAAGYGNISAVCWFLDNGASIDHRNSSGHTALQYSIIKQQTEATNCLLQQGSDINLLGPKGVTPLMQAALFRDVESVDSISRAGGIWNLDSEYLDHCLAYSLEQDLASVLKIAMDQGLSPKYRIYQKWPLDWLAKYYESSKCNELLDPEAIVDLNEKTIPEPGVKLHHFDRSIFMGIHKNENVPHKISCRTLIDQHGFSSLSFISTPMNRFLENDIRSLASKFTFESPVFNPDERNSCFMVDLEISFPDSIEEFPESVIVRSFSIIDLPNPE